jgi:argininosuccinate synthase
MAFACQGGLGTSVAIGWLAGQTGAEVIEPGSSMIAAGLALLSVR